MKGSVVRFEAFTSFFRIKYEERFMRLAIISVLILFTRLPLAQAGASIIADEVSEACAEAEVKDVLFETFFEKEKAAEIAKMMKRGFSENQARAQVVAVELISINTDYMQLDKARITSMGEANEQLIKRLDPASHRVIYNIAPAVGVSDSKALALESLKHAGFDAEFREHYGVRLALGTEIPSLQEAEKMLNAIKAHPAHLPGVFFGHQGDWAHYKERLEIFIEQSKKLNKLMVQRQMLRPRLNALLHVIGKPDLASASNLKIIQQLSKQLDSSDLSAPWFKNAPIAEVAKEGLFSRFMRKIGRSPACVTGVLAGASALATHRYSTETSKAIEVDFSAAAKKAPVDTDTAR
jgi:hypothetical protein